MDSGRAARLMTLGRLTLLRPDGSEDGELVTRKRKLVLLTLLAVSRRPWTRDALVDLFWGEQPEERARHSLSDALSHLRRVLGPDSLTQRRSEVTLGEGFALDVDVLELQAAARSQRWDTVVALHGGRFLDGVHAGGSPRLEQWIDAERLRLDGVFATAARAECERLLRSGAFDDGAALALRWLEVAPTSPHAALCRVRAIAGDGTPESDQRALDEFTRIDRRLVAEYGVRTDRLVVDFADDVRARIRGRQPSADAPRASAPGEPVAMPADAPTPAPERVVETVPVSSSVGPLLTQLAAVTARRDSAPTSAVPEVPDATAVGPAVRPWLAVVTLTAAAVAMFVLLRPQPAPLRAAPGAPARPLSDSPQALALYQSAITAYDRDGNREEAVRLLDSAIALDSSFAMAYRRLGNILNNGVDSRSRTVTLLTLAARHSDRLPEQERLLTLGSFHTTVTGDFTKAAAAYRALLELAPQDARAWGSLGAVYDYLGDRRRAEDAYARSLRLNPKRANTWMNLSDARYVLGDVPGAWRALDSMALVFPGHPGLFMRTAALAHGEGQRELAESQLRALVTSAPNDLYLQSAGEMLLAKALWSWGRLKEGDAARERSISLDRRRGSAESALTGALDLAMASAWLRRDTALARRQIAAALRATPPAALAPQDRPHLAIAIAFASAGDSAQARAALAAHARDADSLARRRDVGMEHLARGLLALAEQRPRDAVNELVQAADPLCGICGLPELGLAYERLGMPDSAHRIYRRYLQTPSQRRLDMTDAFHGTRIRAALLVPIDSVRR